MVLVDTSVWVDHLRRGNVGLRGLLEEGAVASHPFVIGELACGGMESRGEVLGLLAMLPSVVSASHDEARQLLEAKRLFGRGLGWIDIHLLASALLTGTPLWTLDRSLGRAARALKIDYSGT